MVNHKDHCKYTKRSKNKFVILSLYIDDILIAKNDSEYITTIKERLSSFEMKEMGKLHIFLDINSKGLIIRLLSLS